MSIGGLGGFVVSTEFSGPRVVVSVGGELDVFSAGELETILRALFDRGHRSTVLDLAGCDFVDASGLRTIAHGAERLARAGGALTIRSPSKVVRLTLGLAGLTDAGTEPSEPIPGRLGTEQPTPPRTPGSGLGAHGLGSHGMGSHGMGSHGLGEQLRAVGAIPAGDDVVDGALRLVVALAQAAVRGADGVSVSLRRGGRLSTVAATDHTVLEMDAEQYSSGEGPCVDASMEGRGFHAESLGTETRWPTFTPKARELGINAILSSPLVVRDRPVGALNIYSRTAAAFADTDRRLASVFASEASTILAGAGVDITAEQLAGRLGDALQARHVIALAQGVLMERHGQLQTGASSALRRSSVRGNRTMRQIAADVVASVVSPIADEAPGPSADDRD